MTNGKVALIGLDGFDMQYDHRFLKYMPFVKKFMDEHAWKEINCDTEPHSAPSWFSIFTGVPQRGIHGGNFSDTGHQVHGFYQFTTGEEWVTEKRDGDKPWNMNTIDQEAHRVGGFIWHKIKSAVAQGIMCMHPHYSHKVAMDKKAYYDGMYNTVVKAQTYVRNFKKAFDSTIKLSGVPDLYCCTIQIVDQIHHKLRFIPMSVHNETMGLVDFLVSHVAKEFDKIFLLSDHGIAVPKFIKYETHNVKMAGHRDKCFLAGPEDAISEISGTLQVHDMLMRALAPTDNRLNPP
jgi:hypothetical protein